MRRLPPLPQIKIVQPVSWYETALTSAADYISHLLTEIGRLGLKIGDIEDYSRPPNKQTVLSDLLSWLDEGQGGALAKIVNWQWLDLPQIQSRLDKDGGARPRIEISAHITKMNNLSVRWYPGGWRSAVLNLDRSSEYTFNLVAHRKWKQQPDFYQFRGDEDPTFDSRPSNELMYIRGVGNLHPEPRDSYGPYSKYNNDVVDSILICAVRMAYEGLVAQLSKSFEVEVIDAFDFTVRDEVDDKDAPSGRFPKHRVISWRLEDAAELRARREEVRGIEQEQRDRSEFENTEKKFGFTLENLVDAVLHASSKKSSGPAPSRENADRNAAKNLRAAGFAIDASSVRRIRHLIERYRPEILPEAIRAIEPQQISTPSNVVPFPEGR